MLIHAFVYRLLLRMPNHEFVINVMKHETGEEVPEERTNE